MADFDYDVVFVGRGYSITTYLLNADLDWTTHLLLIGGVDSWDSFVRGDGVVNHARYIYARTALERKSLAKMPSSRLDLVNDNKRILQFMKEILEIRGKTFEDEKAVVTSIKKVPTVLTRDLVRRVDGRTVLSKKAGETIPVYHVTWEKDERRTFTRALKVVYGGGAGPQRAPGYVDSILQSASPERKLQEILLDLDTFVHFFGERPERPDAQRGIGKGLALVGPNAGIDGAIAALNQGFDLFWLIRGRNRSGGWTVPAWIPTRHYEIRRGRDLLQGEAAVDYANGFIVHYERGRDGEDIKLAVDERNRITVIIPKSLGPEFGPNVRGRVTHDDTNVYIEGLSLFTYAVGQNPDASEYVYPFGGDPIEDSSLLRIGPGKVLQSIWSAEKLQPIYDLNQRFGASYETVLGLQDSNADKYGGLEVLGAAAYAMASDRGGKYADHAYFGQSERTAQETRLSRRATTSEAAQRFLGMRELVIQTSRSGDSLIQYILTKKQGKVPSLNEAMREVATRLNQKSVGTGDQLGTVRAQVEAVTGFDLRSDSVVVWYVSSLAEYFNTRAQAIVEAIQRNPVVDVSSELAGLDVWTIALIEVLRARGHVLGNALDFLFDRTTAEAFWRSQRETAGQLQDLDTSIRRYNTTRNASMVRRLQALQAGATELVSYMGRIAGIETLDFNGADRTELAVSLGAAFPKIDPEWWDGEDGIITKIIGNRAEYSPWGYDSYQSKYMLEELKQVNAGERAPWNFVVPPPRD
ncbi:MAG: hypothetical protein AAF533_28115 [Acidobacteriota bacterium]